jgi:hypothetical protein
MILALFKPKKIFLIFIMGFEIFLMSMDQMRWQPTLFQFLITLWIAIIEPKEFKLYFFSLLSLTYVFSGLHKLNLGFINFIWGKFFLVDFFGIPTEISFHPVVKSIGFIFPVIEILSGVLLWTKYKKIGWGIVITMHLFLLIVLGPLGNNYNSIVWPWNVLMILFALIFIIKTPLLINFNSFKSLTGVFLGVVLILLPVLSFFGKYTPYLSFGLYSGNTDYLYVRSSCLYNYKTEDSFGKSIEIDNDRYVSVFNWSMTDLNVPMIPYMPVFKDFEFYFNRQCSGTSKFLIQSYPYKNKQTWYLN